jgi:hypothetical protein
MVGVVAAVLHSRNIQEALDDCPMLYQAVERWVEAVKKRNSVNY